MLSIRYVRDNMASCAVVFSVFRLAATVRGVLLTVEYVNMCRSFRSCKCSASTNTPKKLGGRANAVCFTQYCTSCTSYRRRSSGICSLAPMAHSQLSMGLGVWL